jgi:tetratricopeptide (TPR) repeat protein
MRTLTWIATGLGIGALLVAGVWLTSRRVYAARLPELPDFAGRTTAVVEHIRTKDLAARADPTSKDAVGALCLAYHADMFYDQAERCYERAEELNPTDWRSTYYRALAAGERGNRTLVATAMSRVVQEVPDFSPAWWRLGEAEFKQARYDRAENAWRRAETLPEPARAPATGSPEHIVGAPIAAYAGLGLARLALVRGDHDTARQILEQVTSRTPRFGPAFRLLGDTYERLGRHADAERAVHRANGLAAYAPYADPLVDVLARESRNSTFLLQQAAAADLNAYWNEYLTRRALEFDPTNADVVYKLGFIERTLGRNDEALELFQRYQQMVPGDYQVLGQIGSCLGDLGRFGEAEASLRRALTRVDDALTHYNLGFILTRTGRLPEAVVEYERALARDPNHLAARTNLASVLVRQGQLDRAAREIGRVLDIEPDNAAAHTNLGLLLAQQGRMDQAGREFEEALRINPQQREAQDALRTLGRR